MTNRRQQPISISNRNRAILNQQKARYDSSTGQSTNWGQFLETMALLGLAAAGIYALAKASRRSSQSVDVQCSPCGANFIMAVPEGAERAVYTTCPHCGAELVVDLGASF
ncbi:hypothetical protein ACFLWX_01635 [Chloroflexota bacterium]